MTITLCGSALAAPITKTSAEMTRFASDTSSSSRFEFDLKWKEAIEAFPSSPDQSVSDHPDVPLWQLQLRSFVETGDQGDWSLDLDPVVVRPVRTDYGHVYLGRIHPRDEWLNDEDRGRNYGSGEVKTTSAIGANWAQNRSNALLPRVSGWIGAGIHAKLPGTGLSMTLAASPVFLPSFGPGLTLSETDAPRGTRFADVPPQYYKINGNLIPLRYRLDTGDLKNIILQNQAYASVEYRHAQAEFTFAGWTAPAPNPSVDAGGALYPSETTGTIKGVADIQPSFPREIFYAATMRYPSPVFEPEFEAVYETFSQRTTVSSSLRLLTFLQGGVLHRFAKGAGDTEPTSSGEASQVKTYDYAKELFWWEASTTLLKGRFRPAIRHERHFTSGQEDDWVRTELRYIPERNFGVYARASLLAGARDTYFGRWRGLDSLAMGATFVW